jgi:hypothetical protein
MTSERKFTVSDTTPPITPITTPSNSSTFTQTDTWSDANDKTRQCSLSPIPNIPSEPSIKKTVDACSTEEQLNDLGLAAHELSNSQINLQSSSNSVLKSIQIIDYIMQITPDIKPIEPQENTSQDNNWSSTDEDEQSHSSKKSSPTNCGCFRK